MQLIVVVASKLLFLFPDLVCIFLVIFLVLLADYYFYVLLREITRYSPINFDSLTIPH